MNCEGAKDQNVGRNLRYSTSSSRLTTKGVEPSQASRMTASSAANSTNAEITSPLRASSITSPASILSLRIVVMSCSVWSAAAFSLRVAVPNSIGANTEILEAFLIQDVPFDTTGSGLRKLRLVPLRKDVRKPVADTIGEHRVALLQKADDTLPRVRALAASEHGAAVGAVRRHRMRGAKHAPHHLAREGHGDGGRVGGDIQGQLPCGPGQVARFVEAAHETAGERLVGVEHAAGVRPLERRADADDARQEPARGGFGHDSPSCE